MIKKQRKKYSADFKVKVALEAIKGQRQVNEIASDYGVHPNQVMDWRRQAINGLSEIFSQRRTTGAAEEEALKAQLFQEIGELKFELDWLKKKAGL